MWDLFITDGDCALFRAAIGVLRFYAPQLLRSDLDDDDVRSMVSRLPPAVGLEGDALVAGIYAVSLPWLHVESEIAAIDGQLSPRVADEKESRSGTALSPGDDDAPAPIDGAPVATEDGEPPPCLRSRSSPGGACAAESQCASPDPAPSPGPDPGPGQGLRRYARSFVAGWGRGSTA